jgi:A/G-specific adenine glycosylase
LAAAPLDDVLAHWAGLGYYARARNLHQAAQMLAAEGFPQDLACMMQIKGVGRSTAGAILAQAFGQKQAILDGNVRRVLARWAGVSGWTGDEKVQQVLWQWSERLLPDTRLPDYTQSLMDLGASLCGKKPQCGACPLKDDCQNHLHQLNLPTPKPKSHKPRRHEQTYVQFYQHKQALWLQKRPPKGIWGGLWCPPLSEQASAHPLQNPLEHSFTHYDLTLHPQIRDDAPEEDGQWWDVSHLLAGEAALPAPILKLIHTLFPQQARLL